jgi:hypothetical protein
MYHVLCNMKAQYRVHNNLSLVPNLKKFLNTIKIKILVCSCVSYDSQYKCFYISVKNVNRLAFLTERKYTSCAV